MRVSTDNRGNYNVILDNTYENFINKKPVYIPQAPEMASWAPEWLLVPELEFYTWNFGRRTQTTADVPYGEDPRITIPNFYGGSTLDPTHLNYPPGMTRWAVVKEEWKKDDDGLYYWTIAKQGFRIFIERHVLDILREVHGPKFAGPGNEVPVTPAWKDGKLVSRMVPFAPLEQFVVNPPFENPRDYVQIVKIEDPRVGREPIRNWRANPSVTFEEMLSAGFNLKGCESAVAVEKPFQFGVVYKLEHEITSTFCPPSQGLPAKWVRKILNFFKKIEKLDGAGQYYLPLRTFTLARTCAGNSPQTYLLPSAWAYVIDFTANAPVAYLNYIISNKIYGPEGRKEA